MKMAELTGMPLWTFKDIERGNVAVRQSHINAAVLALIENASVNGGYDTLPVDIGELVRGAGS